MSFPHPEQPDAAAAPSVLRILSGLHAGASRTLAEQEMILVGSGDDCDIVLADHGVARHHALINLVGGLSSLRALDAPLRVDGQPLHPGDPVELRGLQRIQLGEAAIAFGAEHDPGWAALLPGAAEIAAMARPASPGLRRLPVIAALAVLSLASLAIFAAVMPSKAEQADARTQLQAVINRFQIGDGRIGENVNGEPVLSGTVADNAARQRILQYLGDHGIDVPPPDLRTGENIAADVSEVLRSQGVNARTRYIGNGVVEASGRFEDLDKLRAAASSRAMGDVPGVTRVLAKNYVEPTAQPVAATGAPVQPRAAAQPAARIVSVVRGKEPHLVGMDGVEYPVGADIPGRGRLVSIGESAHVIDAAGMLHKVVPQPVTAEELAAAAEQRLAEQARAPGSTEAAVADAAVEQATSPATAAAGDAPERAVAATQDAEAPSTQRTPTAVRPAAHARAGGSAAGSHQ